MIASSMPIPFIWNAGLRHIGEQRGLSGCQCSHWLTTTVLVKQTLVNCGHFGGETFSPTWELWHRLSTRVPISGTLLVIVLVPSRFSRIQLSVTPWMGLCQASLSMNSLGKNTEVGCHALPPVDLPHPGIDRVSLMFPALASGFFITKATWEALLMIRDIYWEPPREFPGGPVVRTACSHCWRHIFNPWLGN